MLLPRFTRRNLRYSLQLGSLALCAMGITLTLAVPSAHAAEFPAITQSATFNPSAPVGAVVATDADRLNVRSGPTAPTLVSSQDFWAVRRFK